ncbi:hypothetical protein LY76DRAFT_376399 [Colletotrichum caudatum]|nr:hypothetical protein LY76DRAFT_376399 [Colletotrichum caudatum]
MLTASQRRTRKARPLHNYATVFTPEPATLWQIAVSVAPVAISLHHKLQHHKTTKGCLLSQPLPPSTDSEPALDSRLAADATRPLNACCRIPYQSRSLPHMWSHSTCKSSAHQLRPIVFLLNGVSRNMFRIEKSHFPSLVLTFCFSFHSLPTCC